MSNTRLDSSGWPSDSGQGAALQPSRAGRVEALPPGSPDGPRHAQPMLLLHQAVAIVAAASQVTITATQWSQASSHTGRALTALLAAGLVILAFGVVRYPHYYWRHRRVRCRPRDHNI